MSIYRFGDGFELDTRTWELRHEHRVIRLEPIPMRILLLLLERRPDLVTRKEIAERVWGPDLFLDTDNGINVAMRKIRLALKDDSENPRYIRTIPGMGYRIVTEVVGEEAQPDPPKVTGPVSSEPPPEEPSKTARGIGRWRWAAVLGPLALAGFLALYVHGSPHPSGSVRTGDRLMLAVLPFENLTGDPNQDYFTDGFTEEIIARLGSGASQRLGVIARTSSMHYKQSHAGLDTIGRELGVQYVLEGSVRRDAGRVRITVQLVLVKDQSHLWSRQYDRQQTDILAIQEEVAQSVADRIRVTLAPLPPLTADRKTLSDRDSEAYDLYLKGRHSWNERTEDGFQRAAESFQKSIALNPSDARAHAGLADTYALMATYSFRAASDVVPKARDAALQALEIDSSLAAPYATLALVNEFFDWDWQGAEERFRKAIELDRNYATAHQWYAEYLSHQGRFDEALEEIAVARRLDPLSLIIATDRGVILYDARRYPEAIDQLRAVMDVHPFFGRTPMIILSYTHEKRFDEALALIQKWRSRETPWTDALAAYTYGQLGRAQDAQKALENMEESARRSNWSAGTLLEMRTMAYCGMGLKDKALATLQQACETRYPFLASLKVRPMYDFVRDDPRFQEILGCVGLAQ